jgi:hypothetical protein
MSKQPDALVLADALDKAPYGSPYIGASAAELRRLHEVNAELLEALNRLMDMDVAYNRGPMVEDAVTKARAAIAKGEQK